MAAKRGNKAWNWNRYYVSHSITFKCPCISSAVTTRYLSSLSCTCVPSRLLLLWFNAIEGQFRLEMNEMNEMLRLFVGLICVVMSVDNLVDGLEKQRVLVWVCVRGEWWSSFSSIMWFSWNLFILQRTFSFKINLYY